ncbi:MAG: serine hydrolase [bacterium]|jgi:CubicO group peptidase (beta-lactamase class C family)
MFTLTVIVALLAAAVLQPYCAAAGQAQAAGERKTISPGDAGVDQQPLSRLAEDIREGRLGSIHSIVLVKDGEMVYEDYYNGYDRDRLQYTASISKSVGSILFGMAMDQGLLPGIDEGALEMSLSEILPEYRSVIEKDAAKSALTLHHVLSMTAGLEWDEQSYPYSDPHNDWNKASRSDDPVRFVLERPVVTEPGTEFEYNGGLSIILSYLIENASGRKADEFAEEYLFGPLGIEEVRWDRLPSGLTDTDGGLHMRPRDMAKIGMLYLNGGIREGEQVVSRSWVEVSTRVHIENDNSPDYGYQWWCGDFHHHGKTDFTFLASGHGGQTVFVFPAFEAVAVIAQEVFDNPMGPMNGLAILNRYILPAIDPESKPAEAATLSQAELDLYTGIYETPQVSLTVTREDDTLHAQGSDGTSMVLVPLGDHSFRGVLLGLIDIHLEFEPGADGGIERLTSSFGFRETVMDKRS